MKDILKEYYSLELEYYREYNGGLIFFVNGDYYYLCNTVLSDEEVKKAYDLYLILKNKNIILHDFIFNDEGELKSKDFVLLKLNYLIDDINTSDLIKLQVEVDYDLKDDFYLLWTNKLDYLEKQLVDLSNNNIINYSFDYFLGIAELLLSYYKDNIYLNKGQYIVHRMFYSLSTVEFYNPLNILLGDRYKDFSSYVRLTNDWDLLYDLVNNINVDDRICLFVRLSFPFYYFNLVNKYLIGEDTQDKLMNLVKDIDKYEEYLWKIERIFGINLFNFMKKDN